jgi:Zincin-like metallopeptidase
MNFDTFSRRAAEILDEVPAEFLRGVTGVEAHPESEPHPHIAGVYTLGVCASDELSAMTDPEGLHSSLHLYHGSFAAVAFRDEDFDWEGELRETILHEIRHHIEDRAGLPDLRDEDALEEGLSRFMTGEDLPSGWYRHGEEMEADVWRVGEDLFVELRLRGKDLDAVRGDVVDLTVLDEPLQARMPDDVEPGDILSFDGEGLERPGGGFGDLHLILVTSGSFEQREDSSNRGL